MDWSNMDTDDELGTNNLSPINETNPNQDFNWQQEHTDVEPLQNPNPQQETPELELLLPHVETNHGHLLNQAAEPSPEPSRKVGKAKLTEPERKKRKRESDRRYRQKQKDILKNAKEVMKEMENIEKQVVETKSKNEHIQPELKHFQHLLEKEIRDLKPHGDLFMTVQGETIDVNKMFMNFLKNAKEVIKEKENIEKQARQMKSEKERQEKYIRHLEKEIKELKSQRHEFITDVQGENDDVNKMILKWLDCQPCNATVPAAAAEFFRRLEEDEESNVDFKDFTDLHEKEEYRTVGKYQIPLSLVPTAEKITEVYGDDCVTSKINRNQAGNIYILFCATIKEMSELPLEKVTEKTMLKWRDAIKDALCIKFKVEFAMEHLKKTIAPRYFGMKAYEEAEKIDVDISNVEPYLNGLKECKKFIDIAKEFDDKPFSEGLWDYSVFEKM